MLQGLARPDPKGPKQDHVLPIYLVQMLGGKPVITTVSGVGSRQVSEVLKEL